ncbi:MAG: barstar family protein [Anaerolineae bacterium]|nr:barstar family protein [Anaerolineae bacterium]
MKDRLDDLLAGRVAPGLYRLSQPLTAAAIAARAGRYGWQLAQIKGRPIRSKAAFLDACAEALAFPAYFGHNWDALADCLRDLSWLPTAAGRLILYEDAGTFAAAAPADFAVALAILRAAVADWQDTSTPLAVLLRRAGRAAPLIPRL